MKHIVALLIAATGMSVLGSQARAGVDFGPWNYAIDSQNDGSGGGVYEMRGLAFSLQSSAMYVAVSSGMKLGGNTEAGALNGSVANGDLFLNFSGHNLTTAASFTDPKVLGIRFDAANDSLGNTTSLANSTTGLYSNLSVALLATQNIGYASLQAYLDHGFGRTTGAMGDLQSSETDVKNYLGSGAMITNITSGNRLGSISLLSSSDLTAKGLDFGHFGANPSGNYVYGFSFNRSLLGSLTGSFTMHLFEECTNDGMALVGSLPIPLKLQDVTPIPEPATWAGALVASLVGLISLKKRRHVTGS